MQPAPVLKRVGKTLSLYTPHCSKVNGYQTAETDKFELSIDSFFGDIGDNSVLRRDKLESILFLRNE